MICKMEHRWDEMEQCGIKVVKRRVGFRRTWREPVLMRTPTSPFNSEYPDEIIDIGAIVGEVMFQSSEYVIPLQRREKPRISLSRVAESPGPPDPGGSRWLMSSKVWVHIGPARAWNSTSGIGLSVSTYTCQQRNLGFLLTLYNGGYGWRYEWIA